ncbi:slipin family protein [Microbulbifer variabilis]|uniref:slipin family protein n=1 Tax=Microbulbifer variabilis TaxID=266805 RepID=UPI001CFF2FAE|nr:slipin family protein [Microbulbifer variabilis]
MKSLFKIWKIVDVADSERALLFRRSRFERVLPPGRHRIWLLSGDVRVETYDITEVVFDAIKAKFLLNTYGEILGEYLQSYELSDHQVGLFYRDGHLVDILPPGTYRAVWKGIETVRVGIVDISEEYSIDEQVLGLLGRGVRANQMRIAAQAISYNEIPDEHVGLLVVNGKLEKVLQPGRYGFWKYNRSIAVKLMDMRLQTIEVSGQEILTKDRVSLRINLSGSFKITDPQRLALKLSDYKNYIYRELQLYLREAVGTQTLDSLLADKDRLNIVIATGIRKKLAEYGIEIVSVGVKDIILPGDMKMILNQVVEAQKESEANLIKRREETQAMRSLHNTAKMMDNNPTLLRLKELESLERVSNRIDKISVYGGLEGVLNDLVKLRSTA